MSIPSSPSAAHSTTPAISSTLVDGVVDSRFLSTKKISVLLDDTNFLLWRQQVLLAIKTFKLQQFLDTRTVSPPSFVSNAVLQENPEFAKFEQQDIALASWLLRALHSQRKGDLSMKDFLMKIKGYCDNLASCGEAISDHEHVTAILNGLSSKYESVITIITASPVPYTAQGVNTMLLDAEARQQVLKTEVPSSANVVTHQSALSPAYRPPSNTRGRGRGRSSGSRFQCQLCGKQGHLVDRCYYRFDASYKSAGYKPPPQPQANVCMYGSGSSQPGWYFSPVPVPTWPNSSLVNAPQPTSATSSVSSSQALIATPDVVSDNAWYPDSGATHHLTHSPASMGESTSYNSPGKVYVGNGATLPVLSNGQSSLLTRTRPLYMRSLLFVPGITKNLLSVSKFIKDNQVIFEFLPTQCRVRDLTTREVLLQGSVHHSLYKLDLSGPSRSGLPSTSAQCFTTSSRVSLNVWHVRLGHPCKTILAKALASCNVPLDSSNELFPCVAYHLGKEHKLPFQKSTTEYTTPLQLIVANVWGPAPVSSNGFFYYVAFTDAYTRYTWVYFLKRKSKVLTVFPQFHRQVERTLGCKLQTLQTDGGGEFRALKFYLTQQGIVYRFTCPYTSTQNGIVERKHRQIVEAGLSMLAHAAMPLTYWNDAVIPRKLLQ
ncbi:hypothetical protein CXB51_011355 [Gossypium anomalum]|uniref:Integrase catalytic domain-containing protein n=1 Tax=Gossypium anomalum TaxID=47600 RepID=A0A8J5YVM1_9ROSI|nr:hypothetical protein CXB51_011355 [Gossypium anomalum]